MIYSRFLLPENIRQGAVLQALSDEPIRRYLGTYDSTKKVNFHPVIAQYFQNLIFDQSLASNSQGWQAFRESALWNALFGNGVVLRQGDGYFAIDPRFWWPILIRNRRVGSIIVYPFSSDPGISGHQIGVPDRAMVVVSIDADPRALVEIYEWSGVTLGRLVERNIIAPVRVAVWGDGVSEFQKAGLNALDELADRATGLSAVLQRNEKPHIQAPASAISYTTEGKPTLNLSKQGSVLPVQPGDREWKYVMLGGDSPLHKFLIETVITAICANTSIPRSALGLSSDHPRADSGNALQVENNSTFAKARGMQIGIALAAASIGLTLQFAQPQERPNEQQRT